MVYTRILIIYLVQIERQENPRALSVAVFERHRRTHRSGARAFRAPEHRHLASRARINASTFATSDSTHSALAAQSQSAASTGSPIGWIELADRATGDVTRGLALAALRRPLRTWSAGARSSLLLGLSSFLHRPQRTSNITNDNKSMGKGN